MLACLKLFFNISWCVIRRPLINLRLVNWAMHAMHWMTYFLIYLKYYFATLCHFLVQNDTLWIKKNVDWTTVGTHSCSLWSSVSVHWSAFSSFLPCRNLVNLRPFSPGLCGPALFVGPRLRVSFPSISMSSWSFAGSFFWQLTLFFGISSTFRFALSETLIGFPGNSSEDVLVLSELSWRPRGRDMEGSGIVGQGLHMRPALLHSEILGWYSWALPGA